MPNFLPKSSFARSALIIGLVIGLSQGITLWFFARNAYPVSYTHLTLPTNREV